LIDECTITYTTSPYEDKYIATVTFANVQTRFGPTNNIIAIKSENIPYAKSYSNTDTITMNIYDSSNGTFASGSYTLENLSLV